MRVENIFFDLDGTLIDSAPSILEALKKSFEIKGITPNQLMTKDLIGPPLKEVVSKLLDRVDAEMLNETIEVFKQEYDDTFCFQASLYDEVDFVLSALQEQKIAMYVVTNKRAIPTAKILKATGIRNCFNGVYSPDSASPSLNDKIELLTYVIGLTGVSPANTIYIGDRKEDGVAALFNKLRFLYAAWGYEGIAPLNVELLTSPMDILSVIK